MCGIEIIYDQGYIVFIKGDKCDLFSKGFMCLKVVVLQDIYDDFDCLYYLMLKILQGWEQISWENVLNEVVL